MKRLITLITLVGAISCSAQTNNSSTNAIISGPAADAWSFITTAGVSNWLVAPYGIFTSKDSKFKGGGGVAVGYKLSDYVVPVMRLDYLDSRLWMPSGSLQLQLPVTIMNKLTIIPFTFAGVATSVAGNGQDNGKVEGIFGAGAAIRISRRWDVVGDIEKWTPDFPGNQYRVGMVYKF